MVSIADVLELIQQGKEKARTLWDEVGDNPYLDPRVMAANMGTSPASPDALRAGGYVGLGMLPGAGLADVVGLLPDLTGQRAPSLFENLVGGNYVDAGLQALGGFGDAAMFAGLPMLGVSMKTPRAARLAAVSAAPEVIPPELANFGKKAKREAARQKRLEAQTQAQAQDSAPAVRQKGAGKRAKVDPDIYRTMYEEQGLEPVLAAGRRGEHLKPNPDGGWVGAPRTVLTGPQLGHMRRQLDQQIGEGAVALHYADPARMGTWYDRAKAGQALSNEPYQLFRSLEQHGVYSAGAAPENELAFVLRHRNAEALGTGETAYRSAAREALDSAVREDRPADLGFKIGEYGPKKNNPAVVEDSPFGVNDFRMAQTFGYTDPLGQPWRAGVSDQMHPFMDMETALAVERANQRAVGGKTDWTGATAQEVPWVYGKAQDIYGRGVNGRFAGGAEGMVRALQEANNTTADYFPKHALSATYEYTPGANVGHRADILDAPYNTRLQYGEEGRWDIPAAEGPQPMSGGTVGAGRRDALYSALGFRQLPTIESVGNYRNSGGVVESNPLTIGRPLMDFENAAQTGNALTINPPTLEAVRAVERLRGGIDAQEAVAANLPVTLQAKTGKDHVLLDRGRPPTAAEMDAVKQVLAGTGLEGSITATNRGLMIYTGFEKNARAAMKAVQERMGALEQALSGSTGMKAANEGIYEPVMSPALMAGRGITTGRILGQFGRRTPEAATLNVSENEAVRRIIQQKIDRDAGNPNTRDDLQRMRAFFASEDWSRVVALIRKGIKPAAAMAALGYSMQGMAESDLEEAATAQ